MRKMAVLILVAITAWGCATFSRNYKLGNQAEMSKQWDEAMELYERAILENPRESVYRLALIRTKIGASLFHLQEARKLAGTGNREEALKEYDKALSYDPLNRAIAEEARVLAKGEEKKEEAKETRIEPPVKLVVSPEKIDLKFTEASLRSIFLAFGKHAQVNIIFDEQFKDMPFSIDLKDKEFEEALNFLCMASKNFFRVIDEKTVIVIPDRPDKRIQYELNAIKVFYLSNISAQDLQNPLQLMLRTQFRAPNLIVDKNLNSVTIRDTPANLEMAEKLIKIWDKPKGEVIIDLEIMEVSRIKLKQLGMSLDKHLVGLRYRGTESSEEGWYNLKDIDFSKVGNFQITLPISFIQFLESEADTKIIAQPRLRGIGDEEIKYLVGQKVPIPRTTFQPFAVGGISQQPVTSFDYQDVGIDVKMKPRIHFEKEVTLELEMKITSIGGTGIADIPIITTREVKNIIRLKDGETNLLAGLLRDEERKSMRGIAFIKSIPLIGHLFSSTDQTIEQTDVILTITPYIIRTIPIGEEDSKPLWVDLEGISSSLRTSRGIPDEEFMKRSLLLDRERPEAAGAAAAPVEEEAGPNRVFLAPPNFEVPQGREFRMSVNMQSDQEVSNMSLNLSFNPQVVKLKEIIEGGFIRQLGEKVPFLKNIDNTGGGCIIGFSSPELGKGVKGAGTIAILVFESSGQGETAVAVSNVSANSPRGQAVAFTTAEGRVTVR